MPGMDDRPEPPDIGALARFSGEAWVPDHPYFDDAEGHIDQLWEQTIWPVIKDCDLSHVVDLAAGHGRNTRKLLEVAGEIVVLDIQPGNVEYCRQRFAEHENIDFAVNNGFDMYAVPDRWATLIYCFDAMVHFDSDVVRSYLADARRVLKLGGRGFFHHSNYTAGTMNWLANPSSRNFMSKELFAHYAFKEGFQVVHQQVCGWGGIDDLDCITLVELPV